VVEERKDAIRADYIETIEMTPTETETFKLEEEQKASDEHNDGVISDKETQQE
jgi:hypothetical protein